MGILESFKAELERSEENYNRPVDEDGNEITDGTDEEYRNELDKQRKLIAEFDDCGTIDGKKVEYKDSGEPPIGLSGLSDEVMNKFRKSYPKTFEKELQVTNEDVVTGYNIILKRAYCPKCGKEIINKFPTMFNPFTHEQVNRYDCECGWTADIEHVYPRMVITNPETGEETEFFTK